MVTLICPFDVYASLLYVCVTNNGENYDILLLFWYRADGPPSIIVFSLTFTRVFVSIIVCMRSIANGIDIFRMYVIL